MRVSDLARLLKQFPDDAEIRIAACLEDPNYGGNSHDLPITGVSEAFAPANVGAVTKPKGLTTLWLVTSYLLEPGTSQSRKKSKGRL